jgi:hypothetical protein
MNYPTDYDKDFIKKARILTKSLADLIEAEVTKTDGLGANMQGLVYQFLASWLLGSSQMIAEVLEVPVNQRDELFRLCINDSIIITEELLGSHTLKQ